MTIELIQRIVLDNIEEGRLPPYWDDKEVVQGLYKSVTSVFQTFVDMVKDEAEGTSISNAVDRNLDDIGYMFNEAREGRNDAEYRGAILNKMAAFSDSGTTPDVLRYVDSSLNSTYSDLTPYPDTRFGTLAAEGAVVTTQDDKNINQKVSSGARVQTFWDESNQSLVPCCIVSLPANEALQAITDSGNQDINLQLDAGLVDILGFTNEESLVIYPRGFDRSTLSLGVQGMTVVTDMDGNPIELITDEGLVALEALLDNSTGGRYLSSVPVSKTII